MRAFSQERWTVRSATPRMAAISAKVKPQKNFRSTTLANAAVRVGEIVERVADPLELALVDPVVLHVGVDRGQLEEPARFWAWRRRAWSMISPRMTRAA